MREAPNQTMRRKLENFALARATLNRFLAEPQRTEAAEAGIVQAFEFTFEQCWKTFQYLAEREGLRAPSPRAAVRAALSQGYIEQEQLWLDMLDDRNLSSHTYHADLARELVARIEQRYAPEFARVGSLIER